jgi:hypothetical protein
MLRTIRDSNLVICEGNGCIISLLGRDHTSQRGSYRNALVFRLGLGILTEITPRFCTPHEHKEDTGLLDEDRELPNHPYQPPIFSAKRRGELTAIKTQQMLTYGLSLSPTLAHFQNIPNTLRHISHYPFPISFSKTEQADTKGRQGLTRLYSDPLSPGKHSARKSSYR